MHGSKRDAQDMLAKRLAEHADGDLVTRSALTVAAYARHWLGTIAPARNSAKTRERFGQLIELHIVPRIGSVELQRSNFPGLPPLL